MKIIKDYIKGLKHLSTIYLVPTAFFLLPAVTTSCIDEEIPTQEASAEQVAGSSASFKMLINGLNSKIISQQNYYGESYRGTWYATQDWGYPCYMYVKETMLDGFPTTDAS